MKFSFEGYGPNSWLCGSCPPRDHSLTVSQKPRGQNRGWLGLEGLQDAQRKGRQERGTRSCWKLLPPPQEVQGLTGSPRSTREQGRSLLPAHTWGDQDLLVPGLGWIVKGHHWVRNSLAPVRHPAGFTIATPILHMNKLRFREGCNTPLVYLWGNLGPA